VENGRNAVLHEDLGRVLQHDLGGSERHRARSSRAGGKCLPVSRNRTISPVSAKAATMLPSAMAWLMRGRSCITTRPAPRLRWPTSELPI
jgi:hypothetical protein